VCRLASFGAVTAALVQVSAGGSPLSVFVGLPLHRIIHPLIVEALETRGLPVIRTLPGRLEEEELPCQRRLGRP